MPHPARLAVVALVVLVAAGPASAGSITINMSTRVTLTDDTLDLELGIGNSGDEAAGSVVPILRLGDQEVRGQGEVALDPNERIERSVSVPAAGLAEGRWPVRVAVDYTDQNGYPFQALHVTIVTRGDPRPAKAAVRELEIPGLSSSVSAAMVVKNLEATAKTAVVTVFVPEGLEVPGGGRAVELEPWGEQKLWVEVVNRTALEGSRYPVFVTVEYDQDGVHQTALSQGIVAIESPRAFVSSWLVGVVAALVVGWLGILGWRVWRRAPA